MTGLVFASVLSLFAAPAPAKKIAVVAVGQEPPADSNAGAVGELQSALEVALSSKGGFAVKNAAEFASFLPPRTETPPSFDALQRQIMDAQTAYFRGDFPSAAASLRSASAVVESNPEVPNSLRVRFYLVTLSVNLKAGTAAIADDAARQAAAFGGENPPELDDFPSSVADKFTAAKSTLGVPVAIKLTTIPADARVLIDGAEHATVLPGRHVVTVTSRTSGFRPVSRFVETAEAPPTIALPLSLPPLRLGSPLEARDQTILDHVAQRSQADALVVARLDSPGHVHASLWRRGAAFVPLDGLTPAAIADSAVRELDRGIAMPATTPVAAATPVAARTPRPSGEMTAHAASTALALEGGVIAYESFTRRVSTLYNLALPGSGIQLRAEGSAGGLLAVGSVSAVDFLYRKIDAVDPLNPKSSYQISAGSLLHGGIRAGYRLGDREGTAVAMLAGMDYARYSTSDYPTSAGVNVFSGWSSLRALADIEGAWAGPITLRGGVGIALPLSFAESQVGTSGDSPRTSVIPRVRAGADWRATNGLSVGVTGFFEGPRKISFSGKPGQPDVTYKTGVSNATLTETERGLVISASFRY